jgi:hypothetical protein
MTVINRAGPMTPAGPVGYKAHSALKAASDEEHGCRQVVAIDFEKGIAWIKRIGTHKDYDKIDVKEEQHGG